MAHTKVMSAPIFGRSLLQGAYLLACVSLLGTAAQAQSLGVNLNLGGSGGVNVGVNLGGSGGDGGSGGGVGVNVGVGGGTGGDGGIGVNLGVGSGGVTGGVSTGGGTGGGDGTSGGGTQVGVDIGTGTGGGGATIPASTATGYARGDNGAGCNLIGNTTAFEGQRAVDQNGVVIGDILGVMVDTTLTIRTVRFMTAGDLFGGRRCLDVSGENIWADARGVHLPISQAALIAQLASN